MPEHHEPQLPDPASDPHPDPHPDPLASYHLARMEAQIAGSWQDCPYRKCRRLGKCTGGPRGTRLRHGLPLCRAP